VTGPIHDVLAMNLLGALAVTGAEFLLTCALATAQATAWARF
jgi:hypothetical protein